MEGKKRPGRPRKQQPVAPQVTCYDTEAEMIARAASKKYPMNPDYDISRIRRLVVDCMQLINEPKKPDDLFGADYSRKYGYCERTIKQIAEELGVLG